MENIKTDHQEKGW